ncbi:MAG: TetR/AcrR family transcriptional regulator [Chelatococcus sp.]|nr:MAG: TetR/AcrR family transcriptional regulator [Chelatococcus sp.]
MPSLHENEHSFSCSETKVTAGATIPAGAAALPERQTRILDAAERVFARAGFHTATMQDVAREAGMSPGNLYRYFASKDAIITAIAERDRQLIASDFASLDPARGKVLDQLEALGRRHLVEEPREKAILCLQIWAEAARDPNMARMCADIDSTVLGGLAGAIADAKASGELRADLDEARFLQATFMMADGLYCRKAVDPTFDYARAADTLFAATRALAQVLVMPPSAETDR